MESLEFEAGFVRVRLFRFVAETCPRERVGLDLVVILLSLRPDGRIAQQDDRQKDQPGFFVFFRWKDVLRARYRRQSAR